MRQKFTRNSFTMQNKAAVKKIACNNFLTRGQPPLSHESLNQCLGFHLKNISRPQLVNSFLCVEFSGKKWANCEHSTNDAKFTYLPSVRQAPPLLKHAVWEQSRQLPEVGRTVTLWF